jgi:hypothetical protein
LNASAQEIILRPPVERKQQLDPSFCCWQIWK